MIRRAALARNLAPSVVLAAFLVVLATSTAHCRDWIAQRAVDVASAEPIGVPVSVWVLVVVAILATVLLASTSTGRHLYAVGATGTPPVSAALACDRLVLGALIFAVDVLAVVVLGGVAVQRRRGVASAGLLAVALLTLSNSGLVALGVDAYWAGVVKGGALILAVAVDQLVHDQREKASAARRRWRRPTPRRSSNGGVSFRRSADWRPAAPGRDSDDGEPDARRDGGSASSVRLRLERSRRRCGDQPHDR